MASFRCRITRGAAVQRRRDLQVLAGIARSAMATVQAMEHPMSSGNSAGNRASVPKRPFARFERRRRSRKQCDEAGIRASRISPEKSIGCSLAHDLSGPSEIALVRAARLTLEREGHLTILHVVNSELPAPVIEARRAQAKSCLETEVRRWLGRRKLPYRIDIGIGDPAGAIAARAQAHDVDLVVTGRHQRRAVADRFTAAPSGVCCGRFSGRFWSSAIRISRRTNGSSSRLISRMLRQREYGLRRPSFPRRASTFFTHTRDVFKTILRPRP